MPCPHANNLCYPAPHIDDQGIGGHLAGQEVCAEQPVKESDTREVKLKVQQPGRGNRSSLSLVKWILGFLVIFVKNARKFFPSEKSD